MRAYPQVVLHVVDRLEFLVKFLKDLPDGSHVELHEFEDLNDFLADAG
jgi:hypothetical protein